MIVKRRRRKVGDQKLRWRRVLEGYLSGAGFRGGEDAGGIGKTINLGNIGLGLKFLMIKDYWILLWAY